MSTASTDRAPAAADTPTDLAEPNATASPASSNATVPTCLCPNCGFAVDVSEQAEQTHSPQQEQQQIHSHDDALQRAREQISNLESQVRVLNQKAATTAERLADYEDELAKLRWQVASGPAQAAGGPPTPAATMSPTSPTRSSFLPAGAASRISALLSPRSAKSTPNLKAVAAAAAAAAGVQVPSMSSTPPGSTATTATTASTAASHSHSSMSSYASLSLSSNGSSPPPLRSPLKRIVEPADPDHVPSAQELLAALAREQALRRQAEGRLQDTSREVEELSVSLFEQANEMVASERRARARLEARVAVLERRDTDKAARLGRLEAAMDRIERLRRLLAETGVAAAAAAAETSSEADTDTGTDADTNSDTDPESPLPPSPPPPVPPEKDGSDVDTITDLNNTANAETASTTNSLVSAAA